MKSHKNVFTTGLFALVMTFLVGQSAFAASTTGSTILAERLLHTRNHTTEVVSVKTDERAYLEMIYCEGTSISGSIDECQWVTETSMKTRHRVLMDDLVPGMVYTYRIQLVDSDGHGTTTERTFLNR